MWYLKEVEHRVRMGRWADLSGARIQHFSMRIPEGPACQCLYCLPSPQPRPAEHFAWSVHKSFLLASKGSGLKTHSVWKILKSERMWSDVLTCLATQGTHNSEKWSGTFIKSRCELLKLGIWYRLVRAALASAHWASPSTGHVCVFYWHSLLTPLTILLLPPSLYQ